MNTSALASRIGRLSLHPARLEVVMGELVRQGLLTLDELEIHPASAFRRNYSYDIDRAEVVGYTQGEALRVYAHREGLYDQLPPGLFHPPDAYVPGQSLAERLEQGRRVRERETAVRRFFSPFEEHLARAGVAMDLHERELTEAFASPLRRDLLLEVWPQCTRVPAHTLPLLSYILPLSARIAGDLELMADCYRLLLETTVTLRYRELTDPVPIDIAEQTYGQRLDRDFYLAGLPPDELPALHITIGPLDRGRAEEFLPGGSADELLTLLGDCLVPYEVDRRVHLQFWENTDIMQLDESGQDSPSRLGVTTTLAVCA